MKKILSSPIYLAIVSAISLIPIYSHAQSYSVIDGALGLYCADLPDGTNMLTSVVNNGGLSTIATLDPEAEKAKIIKLRKDLQRRIRALQEIKRDYDPTADGAKLKQIYKFVANEIVNDIDADDSLDNLQANKIYRKISALISQLKHRLSELDEAIATIDRCTRNEDLIPPPNSIAPEVITFPFKHPDYGTIEWMRGLGVTAILHKKRIDGVVCVSSTKPHSTINTFPKESTIGVFRNPCLMFWQRAFRNYPFCHYGASEHSAVGWFNITSAGFSQEAVDDSEKGKLQKQLLNYGFVTRAPTKKNPCRTK